MNEIMEYLDNLIEKYKHAKGIKEKEQCAQDIHTFYNSILSNTYYSKRTLKEFKNKYNEISDKVLFKRGIENMKSNLKDSQRRKYIHEANHDIEFINYLMKKIKLDRNVYIVKERKSSNMDDLNKYMNSNKKFSDFLNQVKYDEIVDINIKTSALLNLRGKYLLLLNKDDILSRIDGLMDMYNGYSFDRFFRVPCDLAELALSKELNLTSNIDRYTNIKDLKMIKHGIESAIEYDTYCYGIASLISRTVVEKYGTDFDRIVNIADVLNYNNNLSL